VSRNVSPRHLTAHYGGPSPWRGGIGSHDRCAGIVRGYQAYHMDSNGWSDIAYSSCVCPHGVRFEGRGPGVRTAANGTNAGNSESLATCYIAGDGDPLTDAARHAFRDEADRFGVPLDRVHSDWFSTSCPGHDLRAWVKGGAPRPGVVPPPPGPATPVGPTDWAAVRRFGAALLRRALEARPGIARPGSRGPFVRTVQASLNAIADVGLVEDGSYGPATEAAVRRFQGFARLDVDGIVGPRTVDGLRWFLRMIEDGKA
jgi:hypothetical protein